MTTAPQIIPAPAVVDGDPSGGFTFAASTPIVVESPALAAVARRFAADVAADTGIEASVIESAGAADPGDALAVRILLGDTGLEGVALAGGVRADGASAEAADERHGVDVSPERVLVWGPTPEAVHRGLTSLRQLVAAAASGGAAELSAVRLLDGPRFAWRSLTLDTARTFHDVESVERVLDMLSLYKLNVLHLHLTDDQGWRIEVPSRPALTEVGATGAVGERPGGYFSVDDIAGLVAYAADRFVTLVPEIDMPGHAAAIFASYPELAPRLAGPDLAIEGLPVAIGTLDPARPEVWRFVEDVLDAVIPQFPQSAYLHIGGDEAFGMDEADHAAFVARAVELVRERGRKAVGWQEAARADLGDDVLVQHWIDTPPQAVEVLRGRVPEPLLEVLGANLRAAVTDVPRALAQRNRLIVSPTQRLYFDSPFGDASTDPAQNAVRARLGMPFYPPQSVRRGVEWDPVADVAHVTDEDQVAGVEGAVWCETVTGRDDLELLLLPRLPGLAEKGWATAGATDWDDYRARLAPQSAVWSRRGWNWYRADSVEWESSPVGAHASA
ncbi:hypothetical protein ET445_01240 [Agromyces protaetiae]|uniref:beta-N-acetylhexosaminidase n=1 Tax=Agromyces protaetiae TaxID=2509455 RepID=A0A4P6F8S7_9MICO|nr:family 20 glycosylhydrolase [Agromyces protaetiae]QAY72164.1 hypothetical protein ET445_01240 [Agromyces protaetiae]